MRTINPAFAHHPNEADIVGRLVLSFGEMEQKPGAWLGTGVAQGFAGFSAPNSAGQCRPLVILSCGIFDRVSVVAWSRFPCVVCGRDRNAARGATSQGKQTSAPIGVRFQMWRTLLPAMAMMQPERRTSFTNASERPAPPRTRSVWPSLRTSWQFESRSAWQRDRGAELLPHKCGQPVDANIQAYGTHALICWKLLWGGATDGTLEINFQNINFQKIGALLTRCDRIVFKSMDI